MPGSGIRAALWKRRALQAIIQTDGATDRGRCELVIGERKNRTGNLQMAAWESLTASDIMSHSLITARPDQRLEDVEALLVEQRISGVPVVEAGLVVGVVSRADIARVKVLMQSLDGQVSDKLRYDDAQADGFQHPQRPEYQGFEQRMSDLKVYDAMRHQVISCPANTPVVELADLMVRQHIHRIIVIDAGRPVGVVSSLDIAKLVAGTRTTGKN